MKTSFIVFVSNAAWSARSMGWDWTARHAYPRLRNIVCTALSDHVLCFASSPSERAQIQWCRSFRDIRLAKQKVRRVGSRLLRRVLHFHVTAWILGTNIIIGNIIKSSHAPTISLRNRRNTRKIFAPQTRADQRWCNCLRKRNEGVKTQFFSNRGLQHCWKYKNEICSFLCCWRSVLQSHACKCVSPPKFPHMSKAKFNRAMRCFNNSKKRSQKQVQKSEIPQ